MDFYLIMLKSMSIRMYNNLHGFLLFYKVLILKSIILF
jgi:hypothetical protein